MAVDYTLKYPSIAFAFSPCFLTIEGNHDNLDTATLWVNGGPSETRMVSRDFCRFDLRPFILASLSAQTAMEVDYSKDVCHGAFKKITLYISVEGQGGEESGTVIIWGGFAGIGLMDNMARNRRIPYNPNYPFSLDVFTDSTLIEPTGEHNYVLGSGMPITATLGSSDTNLYSIEPELGDNYAYCSFDIDMNYTTEPTLVRVGISSGMTAVIPVVKGKNSIKVRIDAGQYREEVFFTAKATGGSGVRITVCNLMISTNGYSQWQPNVKDISRVSTPDWSDRRMPTVKGLGFNRQLPNEVTYLIEDSFNGVDGVGREPQEITLYPDNRTDGIYLRWLDKFGRMCYRLFDKATDSLQIAHENKFIGGIEYDNDYDSLVGHNADREYSETLAQRTIKIGEQFCDEYAIPELSGLVASQFVQMYAYNGYGEKWIRVNVVPGSYTIKKTKIQEFSLSIRLPKEPTQHL